MRGGIKASAQIDNPALLGVGYGDILRFATPVFIGQGINAMIGFACRIIAGEMGEKAFNGINIGLMAFLIVVTVLTAVSIGTTVLVAQHWGREDQHEAGAIVQQSLVIGFLISLLLSAAGLMACPFFFSSLNTDPETSAYGTQFLFWIFLFLPLVTPGIFLTAALRGAGDSKTPMRAGLVLAFLSLFLFYGLSLGRFGFPRLEAVGSALAMTLSYGVFSLILIIKVFFKRTILRLPRKGWFPNRQWAAKILKIGTPSAAEWLLLRLGMLVYIFVITCYGEKTLAGYFAGLSFLTLVYALTFGFQTAATTLVGQAVGSGDSPRAVTALKRCIHLSVLFISLAALALYFVSEGTLSSLFRKLDPESIAHARTFIITLIVSMPLMGLSFVMVGGIRGSGDTVRPLIASTLGIFGGRIALAFLIYHLYHPPVQVIWFTLVADILIRIFFLIPGLKSIKHSSGTDELHSTNSQGRKNPEFVHSHR